MHTEFVERSRVVGAQQTAPLITHEKARMLYFQCHGKALDGIFATEVDLVEFGRKVEDVVAVQAREAAEKRCLDFVQARNPELARALRTYLGA
jgi:hypothetical protein